MLFGTGASCSAMKVTRDCPSYAHLVRDTKNSRGGQGGETADGGSIRERGEVTVDLQVDGVNYKLPVRDIDVSMPISSGRLCLSSGDNVALIHKDAGLVRNLVTGKEIKLYGRQGVFFFSAKILPPGTVEVDHDLPFFTRQG